MDSAGNLFVADRLNHRIRKISTSGTITTVAGNGIAGFSGNGGLATAAALWEPCGVAVDSRGNLFIADSRNGQIRKVSPNGLITMVAGVGGIVSSVAVDELGNLFIADLSNRRIGKVGTNGMITTIAGFRNNGASGDGGPATNAELSAPVGLALDNTGKIYVADYGSSRIRVLIPSVTVEPAALNFVHQAGLDAPLPQVLSVSNASVTSVTASVVAGVPWLSVNPNNGSTPTNFTVSVAPGGLSAGTYTGSIRLTTASGPLDVPVTMTVTAACTSGLSSNRLLASGAGITGSFTVNATAGCQWTAAADAPWITILSPGGSGSGPVTFQVRANPGWARTGTITVTGNRVFTVDQPSASGYSWSGLRFVSLSPCRLMDTRRAYAGPNSGDFGPPMLPAGTTRTVPIPASRNCPIPVDARAYVLNVTLDTFENQTGPVDAVTLWPAGETRPDFHTARTTTGGYIANAAIVKAGVNGAINIYTSHNVHLILDITGYFTDDATPARGLLYYPIRPCRAVDTRGPVYSVLPPPYGNQRMQSQETRTFPLAGSPGCQIPVAAAYSMQMTLAPGELTNGNPVAFITAYPAGTPQPNISSMNALFGYAVANSAIIPATTNGSINVFAFDPTNLIIDVNGYFAPDDGTGRGLYYFPVTQCRILDTLDSSFTGPFGPPAMTPGSDRTVHVPSSRCNLSPSAQAWAVNAFVVPNGVGMPFLSLWPSGTPWPNISQLNAFQGQTLANSGIVPASSNGSIDVRVAAQTHVGLEVSGYFAR